MYRMVRVTGASTPLDEELTAARLRALALLAKGSARKSFRTSESKRTVSTPVANWMIRRRYARWIVGGTGSLVEITHLGRAVLTKRRV
jgi:hypothetical protein